MGPVGPVNPGQYFGEQRETAELQDRGDKLDMMAVVVAHHSERISTDEGVDFRLGGHRGIHLFEHGVPRLGVALGRLRTDPQRFLCVFNKLFPCHQSSRKVVIGWGSNKPLREFSLICGDALRRRF